MASPELVAVADRAEVRVYRADGRFLTRVPPRGRVEPALDADADRQAAERAEQVFDLYDIPTELRDSQEADDLLDDELSSAQRRVRPSVPHAEDLPPAPPLVAADAGGLWLAVDGVLYRIGPALVPVRVSSLPGSTRLLAAADDGTVVLVSRRDLLVSGDGGRTFGPVARLEREPVLLAIGAQRSWLAWADRSGLSVVRESNRARIEWPGRVRDLQSCGGDLLVLADDGLHVFRLGADPVRVSGPLPARRMACPRAGDGPWLAVGEGLLETPDQGRSFRARADAPPGIVSAAAFSHDRVWLLSHAAGLTSIGLHETASPASAVDRWVPGSLRAGQPDEGRSRLPRWSVLALPRLTLAASYATTAGRRDFRALAVAELPLGRDAAGFERARLAPRPLALSAEPIASEQVPPQQPDPAYPPPTAPYPPAYAHRYPPRDPDAGCLEPTRARAVARAQAEPERARSLVVRAGRAAWVPELRLRTEKRMGRSESLDVRAGGTSAGTSARDALGLDASNDVRYEVRATWDLPRLVFSPEEVAAVQQALRMADMRREIEAQVNRIYFERRRLLVNPAGAPPLEATGALLRVEELEAELDGLSGGEFSRCRSAGPPRLGL